MFSDPVHQLYNTIKGYCWQTKGKEGTIEIQSNSGRKRITVLGSVDVLDYGFHGIVTESNCDQEAMKVNMRIIREEYPDNKKIVMILDNAKYHVAYEVQDYAQELNIELKYLPTYSPNLNLIERIWKFMKKKMQNTYYETKELFMKSIINFCANLNKLHKDDVSKLINHKFEILNAL